MSIASRAKQLASISAVGASAMVLTAVKPTRVSFRPAPSIFRCSLRSTVATHGTFLKLIERY